MLAGARTRIAGANSRPCGGGARGGCSGWCAVPALRPVGRVLCNGAVPFLRAPAAQQASVAEYILPARTPAIASTAHPQPAIPSSLARFGVCSGPGRLAAVHSACPGRASGTSRRPHPPLVQQLQRSRTHTCPAGPRFPRRTTPPASASTGGVLTARARLLLLPTLPTWSAPGHLPAPQTAGLWQRR
jgi:hypothetical protein